MFRRSALWLGLAAAGLLSGEGYPASPAEEAFVPELAAVGEGICGSAAFPFRNSALLLAQAGKTEVGPAAPAAAAAMPSGSEGDQPLMKGLGTLSYGISTASAQARNDLNSAVRELEAAAELEDRLPYMEPPYWYYPVRQSLGALRVLKGDYQRARDVFRDSLAKTRNNGWALYGLEQAYARQGLEREARTVERELARAWFADRSRLDLARL